MNPELNLPPAELRLKDGNVWDLLRKKFVKLTPEEWVRQHFIHHLINLGYSKNLMQSEQLVRYNSMAKRCDIVAFNNQAVPVLIVECKAPSVPLTEDTFYQICKYYHALKAPLLILTNGIDHIYALLNPKTNEMNFLKTLPDKQNLEQLIHNF